MAFHLRKKYKNPLKEKSSDLKDSICIEAIHLNTKNSAIHAMN